LAGALSQTPLRERGGKGEREGKVWRRGGSRIGRE